jgi:hypothetical protein
MVRAVSERARIWITAIVAGFIAEGLLVVIIKALGNDAQGASILLVFEAIVLGWVFGPWPGAVAAVAPIVVFLLVDLVTASDPTAEFAIAIYAVLLLGFCAWLPGVLRARYGRDR